jgi:hypothetical protein
MSQCAGHADLKKELAKHFPTINHPAVQGGRKDGPKTTETLPTKP